MNDLELLLAGDDGKRELVNVKFFRGSKDVITVEEFRREFRSALMQRKIKTAVVSKTAPTSEHPPIDVREFVTAL
jgi:hypothetical protein